MNVLEKILKRLEQVESELKSLKSAKSPADTANDFERLPPTSTVGKDYVAYRFGCSEVAVQRGRAGTHKLRPFLKSEKPLLWIKSDVDRVWREHSKSPKEKALEGFAKDTGRQRRKSIIKKPAAIVT